MTLNRFGLNRFAIFPKVCDKCDKRFVFERYRTVWGEKHGEIYSYTNCLNCTRTMNEEWRWRHAQES